MKFFEGLDQVSDRLHGCILTIGNFDGVHRGHQQILAQAGMFAAPGRGQVVVMTFDPHPLEIVAPDRAPAALMPLDEKIRCLLQAGADTVVVARSEPGLLSREPRDFIDKIIVGKFKPSHVVEGWSFRFGKDRKGTPELLQEAGTRYGFEVFIVEPVNLQVAPGETVLVTSSLVRGLIGEGHVHRAHLCLGRPYALFGEVEKGHARGKELGFPTANLGKVEQLIPAEGVYAGTAEVCGRAYPAAISIGTTPTFQGQGLQVETFLVDCTKQLYGQPMRLAFHRFLRAQRKFDSPQELVQQINQDVEQVRELTDEAVGAGGAQ